MPPLLDRAVFDYSEYLGRLGFRMFGEGLLKS